MLLKDLEKIDPAVIMNIIQSGMCELKIKIIFSLKSFCFILGESLVIKQDHKLPSLTKCERCAYVSSQQICKACILLEGLNRGLPKLGIGKSSRVNRLIAENDKKVESCNKGVCKNNCSKINDGVS